MGETERALAAELGTDQFTWLDGERLIRFAPGALGEAPALLRERGFERYALVTTKRARASAASLEAAAELVVHVPAGPVDQAAAEIRGQVGGRPVVAFGGGRVIDSAKAVAAAEELRCAAVATTLSGAEMTRIHRLPQGVAGARLVRPSLVVADPDLMSSQPEPDRAASAMNALAHAVEALYGPLRNPVSTLAALRAVELFGHALGDPDERRSELALAALLASYAAGAAGIGIHHVACQTIVRIARTPHAQTNAVMLPHSVQFMTTRAPRETAAVAAALGAERGPSQAPAVLARLAARSGVRGLSELGVRREDLPAVVAAVLARPELRATPSPPSSEELERFLEAAL